MKKKKRARKIPKSLWSKGRGREAVYVYVLVTHDPYDNSIGGPNDYAYGM